MSDLVKRLRRAKNAYPDLHNEAADRIEELEAIVEGDSRNLTKLMRDYAELRSEHSKLQAENAELLRVIDAAKDWVEGWRGELQTLPPRAIETLEGILRGESE